MALTLAVTIAARGEPLAKIVGPTEAAPGNLVILRTEGTVGTGHRWAVIPQAAEGSFLPVTDANGQQAAVFAVSRPGTYTFVLAVAEDGKAALATHTLTLGGGPGPGPDPTPDPDPGPSPGPSGLQVLILEETADRPSLPESQLAILASPQIRAYLEQHADDRWLIVDDDLTDQQLSEAEWSDEWIAAYEQAKDLSDGKRPWLLVTNGEAGASMPLPATVAETLAVLNKYGGE